MHNENNKKTNWSIANMEDIKEIKNIMEYIRGLVIKSQEIADTYETIESMREATKYISAKLDLNGQDEFTKKVIIDNYKEKNKYYIYLNDYFGIDIVKARTASNLSILKSMNNVLDSNDEKLFLECYNEVLNYYNNVFFTKAFLNQQYNYEYFVLNLIAMSTQRYLTKKMKNYFDIDTYDKKQLKNAFISYGFDYFDILPINYQRRLLKLLNELVMSKGTNADIRKILDIFGNKNIDIYKYVICKIYPFNEDGSYDYKNPYLVFYKTLSDGVIDFDKDIMLSFDEVTKGDTLWKVNEDEVLYETPFDEETGEYKSKDRIQRRFNTITSKYMSIDISTDILKDTLQMSYFFNLLYKLETFYKDRKDEEDFGFYNKNITNNKISLFTAIVGFIVLILKKLGIKDSINLFPNTLNDIYGYNNIENNNDIIDLIKEIKSIILQNKNLINKSNEKYSDMYKFFTNFNLYNFDIVKSQRNMDTIYEMANLNSNIEDKLKNGFKRYCNDKSFLLYMDDKSHIFSEYLEKIKNNDGSYSYIKKYNYNEEKHDLIDKLEYLRKSILDGIIEPKYVMLYDDLSKCLSEYTIIKAYFSKETRGDICLILNQEYFREELEDFISKVDNALIKKYYENNDFLNLFETIYQYSLSYRTKYVTKYNISDTEEIDNFLIDDEKYIYYYKNIYAYMNLFYLPFKNEKENVVEKITVSQFMDIFKSNEKLRNQLFEFIKNTDNYQLYCKMNKLYELKFLTKQDTSLYKNYNYFSDYIKDNNYEFYNWLTERDEDIKDGILIGLDKKNYYREKLFELAESIDSYIGTSYFINNPTSGILDFMVTTLNLIVTVFKAFTVDLQQSNSIIKFSNSDMGYDCIKLFDDLSINLNTSFKTHINLEDVFKTHINTILTENNSYKIDKYNNFIENNEIITDYYQINIEKDDTIKEKVPYNNELINSLNENGKENIETL